VEYQDFAEKYFDAVFEVMGVVACNEQTITYGELAQEAGLSSELDEMRQLYELLCDVNAEELHDDRPMLSSVVVRAEDGWPGEGFYTCAQSLGRLPAGANRETKENFWIKELKRVHETWVELAEQEEESEA